jgi:hypothetical protein
MSDTRSPVVRIMTMPGKIGTELFHAGSRKFDWGVAWVHP